MLYLMYMYVYVWTLAMSRNVFVFLLHYNVTDARIREPDYGSIPRISIGDYNCIPSLIFWYKELS